MESSEQEISRLTDSDVEAQRLAASRILDNATSYRLWLSVHERLMLTAAAERSYKRQLQSLRQVAISQIHARALVDYLRAHEVRGGDRRALIRVFYGPRNYEDAVIHAHGQYLRSTVSYGCTRAIGRRLMLDAVFQHWLPDYATAYREYFSAFAAGVLEEERGRPASWRRTVVPQLKDGVEAMRMRILRLPRVPERSPDGFELRAPTDTNGRVVVMLRDDNMVASKKSSKLPRQIDL